MIGKAIEGDSGNNLHDEEYEQSYVGDPCQPIPNIEHPL
jgi:hypothetical protein